MQADKWRALLITAETDRIATLLVAKRSLAGKF
jgi:hypothetical protein